MEEKQETFQYTYSAKEQEEIKRIREKYAPPVKEEKPSGPLEEMRRLDASVTLKPTIIAVLVGLIGTLALGFGMCCTMVWGKNLFVAGIVIGVIGIAGVIAACPLYNYMVRRNREKVAPEILRLSEEMGR